jgi:hypothetical protein
MEPDNQGKLRHWIYVLGGADLRREALAWQERKRAGGKWYQVIEARSDERPDGRLGEVGKDDVLYVYARMRPESLDALGESRKSPAELAAHLIAEGLDRGHRVVKIFASRSGDVPSGGTESASYAERLYHCMKGHYPNLRVYGYLGNVSPLGYASHKTAGLAPGEPWETVPEASWTARKLRASENRIRFPRQEDGS